MKGMALAAGPAGPKGRGAATYYVGQQYTPLACTALIPMLRHVRGSWAFRGKVQWISR